MKAIVMAGGEGTRLRPLTSNQPKPMVPIAGRPCLEHVLALLARHGCRDVVITLAFMPQAIRSWFGSGEELGVSIAYSVEESPAGTAGSVRLAASGLDEPILVISGDAVCDCDLTALIAVHRASGASATIGLKSVPEPLEFGIVVTDRAGRVERFLEKPGWGEVFTDTVNTGIYVLEPHVLRDVPHGRPFDFSRDLFPALLDRGEAIQGALLDGYWQDVGNLDQYRQANFDALDRRVELSIPGMRLGQGVWVGDGVDVEEIGQIRAPSLLGAHVTVEPGAVVGPYALLGDGAVVREGATVTRSIVGAATHVGHGAIVEGAFVGARCEIADRARVHEGAAVGDECAIGAEARILPGVRIYPFKAVEAGTQVDRNVVWESRVRASPLADGCATGLVNVDLTPEVALRLGTAIGTALERGAHVVASREASRACRLVKRALIAGLTSTGVHVGDLRLAPGSLTRHVLGNGEAVLGVHVRGAAIDPDAVEVQLFEPPGVPLGSRLEREVVKHYTRQEFRRAAAAELGGIVYESRIAERYGNELLGAVDRDAIRARGMRLVLDYSGSPAALLLPAVVAALGVETLALGSGVGEATPRAGLDPDRLRRLVAAAGADLGVLMDEGAERVTVVADGGVELDGERLLLVVLRLLARGGGTGTIAVPVTASDAVEQVLDGTGLAVERTRVSLRALAEAAARPETRLAAAPDGTFLFPPSGAGPDACATVVRLLGLLAAEPEPLSTVAAGMPVAGVDHSRVHCPFTRTGAVMRALGEAATSLEADLTDGIKLRRREGWFQLIPDTAEPFLHLYVEAATPAAAAELREQAHELVERALAETALHAERAPST